MSEKNEGNTVKKIRSTEQILVLAILLFTYFLVSFLVAYVQIAEVLPLFGSWQDGIGYQNENMEFMEAMDENFCGKKMIADNFIDDMDKGNYLPLRETPLSGN